MEASISASGIASPGDRQNNADVERLSKPH
jgi:hypothetical protein